MWLERFFYGGLCLCLALFVLGGIDIFCGRTTRVTGVVVGHDYTPEVITYQTPPNGQSGVLLPVTYPAHYYLVLRGPHGIVTVETQPYDYYKPEGAHYTYSESRGLLTSYLYSL